MGFAVVQTPTPIIVTASTSTTISFSSNVTTANLLVANVRFGTAGTPTISDNLGDGVSWIQDANPFPGSTNGYIFHKVVGTGGPCTVTISTSSAATVIRILVREYSGNLNSNANVVDGTGATAGSSSQTTPLSIGPSSTSYAAGDLVVGYCGGGGTLSPLSAGAASPNSDLVSLVTANGTIGIEDELNWAGGTATATFGLAGTENIYGAVVGYKAAAVAIGAPLPPAAWW